MAAPGRHRGGIVAAIAVLGSCEEPSTPAELARGQQLYEASCAACHQNDGGGKLGVASPLVDSEWVLGPEERLVHIALLGIHGPIVVRGKEYNLEMPGFRHIYSDDELAAILTYLRRAWGHQAPAVTGTTVKRLRQASNHRGDSWTAAELLQNE